VGTSGCAVYNIGMKRVLIVDDEVALVRSIAKYLDSFVGEYRVFSAFSGEEGLTILRQQPVDIMLTDVNLPGLDGITVVRRALEMRPELAVVVMTAFGSPDLEAVALREGAMRFVNKPLDLDELRGIIQMSAMVETGWAGIVGGLDLLDLAQLIALAGKSAVVHVGCGAENGILVFQDRAVVHARQGELSGEEAFYRMAMWSGGTFQEEASADVNSYPRNIEVRATHLFMEAARLRDEQAHRQSEGGVVDVAAGPASPVDSGIEVEAEEAADCAPVLSDAARSRTEKLLAEFESISGFLGAAVLAYNNELLARRATPGFDIETVAKVANEGLSLLRDVSARMGVGRCDLVFLRSPKATTFLRCIHEGPTEAGESTSTPAHLQLVVMISPEANVGMAKVMVDKQISRIALAVR
jgi:CheY-like chemotaxis protein